MKTYLHNYDTPASRETCDQIIAFLLGRPLHGATRMEISLMLGMREANTRRYLIYLVEAFKIHISRPARPSPRGSIAAIYKHGPMCVPRIKPGLVYTDLPLAFFKGATSHEQG